MAPVAIDGSKDALVVRRLVVWRRLEPGDVRTPGTELSAESPYLEAKVLEVGISEKTLADLERLDAKKREVHAVASRWSTRYEPGGVLLALGGGLSIGALLDYLPASWLPATGSLAVLGVAVAALTRARKAKVDGDARRRWRAMPERDALKSIEKRLRPRYERFAEKLREDSGFRTEVRVGDIHEADRLVSIELERLTDPATWRADDKPQEVRYSWVYPDGHAVEQRAELEETDEEE